MKISGQLIMNKLLLTPKTKHDLPSKLQTQQLDKINKNKYIKMERKPRLFVTKTTISPWTDPPREASWMDLKFDPPPETKTASFFLLTRFSKSIPWEVPSFTSSTPFCLLYHTLCGAECWILKDTHLRDCEKNAEEGGVSAWKNDFLVFGIDGVVGFEQNPETKLWAFIENSRESELKMDSTNWK